MKFSKVQIIGGGGGGGIRRVARMLKLQIDQCITDFAAVQNDRQA